MPRIDLQTVVGVLSKVARAEMSAKTHHDGGFSWTVEAEGLTIVIFDDSNKIDYVESVIDGTGRRTTFDSFMNTYGFDPIDCLSLADREGLETLMHADRHEKILGRRRS